MAELGIQTGAEDQVCTRCGQPEDLLPIQQAIVLRSFPRRYAALFDGRDPGDPQARSVSDAPADAKHWSPLEHTTYVGALFGDVYIRLCDLLDRRPAEPQGSLGGRPRAAVDPEVEAALTRLDDQTERLALMIMAAAGGRHWRATRSPAGLSPHGLVHRAIDEATLHLHPPEALSLRGPAHLTSVTPGPAPRSAAVSGASPSAGRDDPAVRGRSRRRGSPWWT